MRYWSLDSEISNEYLFWATYGQGFWTRRGAAQPFISLGDSRNALILKPATHLLESYESIAIPAMSQTHLLEKENLNLRTTRDLLLPKLISGEIDVSTFPGL
jgi:type I restriction enzyme S subunit